MTRSRLPVVVAGVVVIVLAFVFLRPDDEEKRTGSAEPAPARTAAERETGAKAKTTTTAKPAPPPVNSTTVVVKGGAPVGGVKRIRANKGDTVRLKVDSDVADEIHLHGYDISREAGPGKSASMKFKANVEGIFEIELENRAVEIASLRVEP